MDESVAKVIKELDVWDDNGWAAASDGLILLCGKVYVP
jgi:hypothetical protein